MSCCNCHPLIARDSPLIEGTWSLVDSLLKVSSSRSDWRESKSQLPIIESTSMRDSFVQFTWPYRCLKKKGEFIKAASIFVKLSWPERRNDVSCNKEKRDYATEVSVSGEDGALRVIFERNLLLDYPIFDFELSVSHTIQK